MAVSLQRLDFNGSGGGWQLVIDGGGAGRTMYFSDTEYGGKRGSKSVASKCHRIVSAAYHEAALKAALKELQHIKRTKP